MNWFSGHFEGVLVLGSFPPPLLLDRLLFESQFLVPIAVLVVAVVVGLAMNRAGKSKPGGIVMLAGLLVAGGVAVSSRVVETDREAVHRGTKEFIAAVVEADRSTVESLLAPRLTLRSDGNSAPLNARSFILGSLDMVKQDIEQHSSSVQESAIHAENAGRTQFVFRVHRSRSFGVGMSTWVLEWQKYPDGNWQINTIDLVAINGNRPSGEVFSRLRF